MSAISSARAALTTCLRGHPLSGDNVRLYILNGKVRQRKCLTCAALYSAERAAEMRAAKEVTLDRAQLRRLLDAHREGVPNWALRERFGLTIATLASALEEARRQEGA